MSFGDAIQAGIERDRREYMRRVASLADEAMALSEEEGDNDLTRAITETIDNTDLVIYTQKAIYVGLCGSHEAQEYAEEQIEDSGHRYTPEAKAFYILEYDIGRHMRTRSNPSKRRRR